MSTATKDAATIERETFPQAFGVSVDPKQPLREASGGSAKHQEYMDKLFTLKRRLAITGVRPAYVINMNPYPLKVNSVLLADTIVPACPLGQPYSVLTIKGEMYGREEGIDGAGTPIDYPPVMLIRDFEEQYYRYGGVVVFEASGNPKKPISADLEIANNPELQEKIQDARDRMIKYATERYMAAQTAFTSPGRVGYRDITDLDRTLTGLLLFERRIAEAPPWMAPTKQEQDLATPCPRCKVEPKKGATLCAPCGFILDPAGAFLLGDISTEDEVGRRALCRLSREQLQELNISHLIEENLDERDERLALEAKK